MSTEMVLVVAHLVIIGVTVAVMVKTIPGVIRRLSSEDTTKSDWSRVLRRTVMNLVALPPLVCCIVFLATVTTAYWGDPTPAAVYQNYLAWYLGPGVLALLAIWGGAFCIIWYSRGMPMPERAH